MNSNFVGNMITRSVSTFFHQQNGMVRSSAYNPALSSKGKAINKTFICLKVGIPHGFKGIVGVHDGVHEVVHDDEPSGGGSVLGEGVPGV